MTGKSDGCKIECGNRLEMNIIKRNPEKAKNKVYDAIIIGGGIYGAMLSLVAAQKGFKTLLLERDDFGGATSFNSLRIVHGGLRYLQKLDSHRLFESVSERKWLLKNFPDLVEPLPCLMPLYGNGLYRPSIFRIALLLNDSLSFNRNKDMPDKSRLSGGKIISSKEVKRIFPDVDTKNLKGGAVWYDGSMPDSQRVLIEALRWACSLGAEALNYFEAKDLLLENNKAAGVKAFDREGEDFYNFKSNIIINAAGPWCRELAGRFDKDYKNLFKSSIAWNILFNRKALSDHALAVTPKRPGSKTYFVRPWKGMLFAGTIHESWSSITKYPMPSETSINNFINDLNSSIANLILKREDILHIFSGLLPAKEEGSAELAVRENIMDHSKENGPEGLFSISGVKFTTARLVAEKTINQVFQKSGSVYLENNQFKTNRFYNFSWDKEKLDESDKDNLREIIETESVQHLDDLILRRTSLGDNPERALKIAPQLCELFDWDDAQVNSEIKRLEEFYRMKSWKKENSELTTESVKN
jgi:glycerol-3-phosphate dehydrogenase